MSTGQCTKRILRTSDITVQFTVENASKNAYNESYIALLSDCTWNKIVTFAGEDVCDVPLKTADDLYGDEQHYAWIINIPENIRNNPNVPDYLLELLDAFTVLSFNTSSENLACWVFLVVKNRLRQFRELAVNNNDSLMIEILDNCEVDSVSYSETPNSMCTYRE